MLPEEYTAKDEEVVVASLDFARVINQNGLGEDGVVEVLQRADVVVELMKVFMFMVRAKMPEDGFGGDDAELYRDSRVEESIRWWLDTFSRPLVSSASFSQTRTLEEAWLVTEPPMTSTPFYQFFTDFTAHYASSSFGHPLFARLLLPPLAASYQPDYKHLIWNDLFELLRTIQSKPTEVPLLPPSLDHRSFLYPLERNTSILRFYFRALGERVVTRESGILYWIAVHHLNGVTFEVGGTIAKDICVTIVKRGGDEVIGDWLAYEFREEGNGWVGRASEETVRQRVDVVKGWVPDFKSVD
jgi:hypothetical protein